MSRLLLRGASLLLGLAALISLMPHVSARAQTSERCFPETGFCIAGRIREFWEQNGGLPVFGFPTTPQQEQQIEGKSLQVQWFERNRLELHPENSRPYDVLLGRLGVDRLTQQQRDWFAFPKGEQQAGCRFFEASGHSLCPPFLGYWQSYGLNLDRRAGATAAESLALFGLPISEPQVEVLGDGQAYTVQWFERARLESHPENPRPYDVLLGLLGNEVHPPPLPEMFAQVDRGETFVFVNPPGSLTHAFVSDDNCRHSGSYGLQLNYSFSEAGSGGWGVQWNNAAAGRFDASAFIVLTFWVKGTALNGFHIGLKDTDEREVKAEARDYLVVRADVWQKLEVPLSRFTSAGVNPAALRNINFGFNRDHGAGSICIDDIAFEVSVPALPDIFAQVDGGEPFVFVNPPGSLTAQFVQDAACRRGGRYGLQLTYGFTEAGNGGWGVQWINAPGGRFDASTFTAFTFWVRGTALNGFQIGLKDINEHEVKVEAGEYLTVSDSDWILVSVPLSRFADARGPVDMTSVRNINLGFNRDHGAGNICVDDIAFRL